MNQRSQGEPDTARCSMFHGGAVRVQGYGECMCAHAEAIGELGVSCSITPPPYSFDAGYLVEPKLG